MAYYAFFSLFPLLLVFTTVLGFVLADNPQAQKDILNSTLDADPARRATSCKTGTLQGSGVALAVGVVVTLLSGLGVTLAAQTAFNRIYGVPMRERPDPIRSRLRGLGLLVVLGTAADRLDGGLRARQRRLRGRAADRRRRCCSPLAAERVLLFGAAFRLLTDRSVPTPRRCGPASWRPRCCGRPCRASAAPTWPTSSATRARPTGRSRRSSGC